MPTSRVRVPDRLVAYLEPLEPLTTQMLAPVLRDGLGRRGHRAWWVTASNGDTAGAIVTERIGPFLWAAHVFLDEAADAAAAGALLQGSKARVMWGPEPSIQAVLPYLRRAAGQPRRQWFHSWPPLPVAYVDRLLGGAGIGAVEGAEFRAAAPADLDGLLALYENYELNGAIGIRRMRRQLTTAIADAAAAVAVLDGRIVAATTVTRRTRRYAVVNSITVDPAYRGRGLGAGLSGWQIRQEAAAGRGFCGERAASNGMRARYVTTPGGIEMVFADVGLDPRVRFRGRRRIEALIAARHGRSTRPRPAAASRYSQVP